MRLAFYSEGGISQFVLTAETKWEQSIIRDLSAKIVTDNGFAAPNPTAIPAKVFKGGFYECRGGWVREGPAEDSLMIRFDTEEAV